VWLVVPLGHNSREGPPQRLRAVWSPAPPLESAARSVSASVFMYTSGEELRAVDHRLLADHSEVRWRRHAAGTPASCTIPYIYTLYGACPKNKTSRFVFFSRPTGLLHRVAQLVREVEPIEPMFRWPIISSKLVNRLRPSTLPVPADPAPATLPRSLLLSWYWRQQVELHQTRCCTHLPRAHQDEWTTRPRRACRPGAARGWPSPCNAPREQDDRYGPCGCRCTESSQ